MKIIDLILEKLKSVYPIIREIISFLAGYFAGKKTEKLQHENEELKCKAKRATTIKENIKKIKVRKQKREDQFKKTGYTSTDFDDNDPSILPK